jgi:serine/threonine protein kinase
MCDLVMMEMEDVRFEDYSLKKRLGRGGFGTVFLAQKISNQQIVAVRLPLLLPSSRLPFLPFPHLSIR